MAPAPEVEDEEDPFSLGDDDDEGEGKEEKTRDVNEEATERLKKAAENKQRWVGKGKGRATEEDSLEGSELVGTHDKVAEQLLNG